MTDEGWAKFWTTLRTMFPAGEHDMTEEQKTLRAQLYRAALDQLSDAEADRAALAVVHGERSSYVPTVATLLDYARPTQQKAVVRVENKAKAQEVYEEIVDSFERGSREIGAGLSSARVEERFGYAAKVAFAAAGGNGTFAWCEPRNEPWRRKAFIEAFEEVGTAEPATLPALPEPTTKSKALPAGSEAFAPRPAEERRPISREEAAKILGGAIGGEALPVERVVPAGLGEKIMERPTTNTDRFHIKVPPKEESTKEMLVRIREAEKNAKPITVTDDRLAELKRQADQIKGVE